jgi:hypothetical protein
VSTIRDEKRRYWEGQLVLAESSGQRITAFCRERGLSSDALLYWRRKLRGEAQKGAMVPKFIPVEVGGGQSRDRVSLPDPRWLAEFVSHLMGNGR